MSLRINQNVLAINAQSQLSMTSNRLEKSIEKLSSGLRINRAADDAAGLAISEKLRRQIRGLSRAVLNAQDGVSMIQSAEGSLNESHSMLQRMRELAIQASNDTLTSGDRLEIQKEVNQLRDDLNRIANNTEFNTKKLLDGSQTALISSSSNAVKGYVTGAGGDAGDFQVSIALVRGGVSQMQRTATFTIDGVNTLAKGNTQLQSIAQFKDANGTAVIQNPMDLFVSGNGKSTTVTVDAQMTLDKLSAAIQNAVTGAKGLAVANSASGMVNTAQSGIAGVGGYIQLTSGIVGDTGRISFAADQRLLDALGFGEIREAVNNQVDLTTRDSFGNSRSIQTESNRAVGLLNGVDLAFSSQAAQRAGLGGLEQGLIISAGGIAITMSAAGATINLAVAAGNWSMEGLARRLTNQLQAVTAGLTAAVVDGQIRMSYNPPLASVASTIKLTAATAGNNLGFVVGTYSGFVQGQRDETQTAWGFSRYVQSSTAGVASGTAMTLRINDGIQGSTVTAYSTFGSGNITADLRLFSNFQQFVNNQLALSLVDVRVDQTGSSLAFTSLFVGNKNNNGAVATESVVRVSAVSGVAVNAAAILNKFGLTNGMSRGSGDTNFKVHILDNSPQFQIGGDQGQSMKVSFQNMSASALGVDNLDMTNIKAAQKSLTKINSAIDKVSAERSKLGAFQNRLEYAINNLRNTHSNLTSAESRVRDADIAQEMIEFTRNQIVNQSGTAMLAQANLIPQGVLQLLK